MTSLYNRATPSQRRMLRIVEGAFRDAAYVHKLVYPEHMPRSVAKRAIGTLSSQWGETLAAQAPSDGNSDSAATVLLLVDRPTGPVVTKRGAPQVARRSPFKRKIIKYMSSQLTGLKKSGQIEKAEAFIEVLKFIHDLRKQ